MLALDATIGSDRRVGLPLRMGRVAQVSVRPQRKPAERAADRSGKQAQASSATSFGLRGFFDLHVAELFGVEDLATLQALDKFGVFVPGNDTYPGVLADGCHRVGM